MSSAPSFQTGPSPAAFSLTSPVAPTPAQAAIGGGIGLPLSHSMVTPQAAPVSFGNVDAYSGGAGGNKSGVAQPKFGYIPVFCEVALGCCAVGCAVPALLIGGLVFGGRAILNLVTWPLRALGGLVSGRGKAKPEPVEE